MAKRAWFKVKDIQTVNKRICYDATDVSNAEISYNYKPVDITGRIFKNDKLINLYGIYTLKPQPISPYGIYIRFTWGAPTQIELGENTATDPWDNWPLSRLAIRMGPVDDTGKPRWAWRQKKGWVDNYETAILGGAGPGSVYNPLYHDIMDDIAPFRTRMISAWEGPRTLYQTHLIIVAVYFPIFIGLQCDWYRVYQPIGVAPDYNRIHVTTQDIGQLPLWPANWDDIYGTNPVGGITSVNGEDSYCGLAMVKRTPNALAPNEVDWIHKDDGGLYDQQFRTWTIREDLPDLGGYDPEE